MARAATRLFSRMLGHSRFLFARYLAKSWSVRPFEGRILWTGRRRRTGCRRSVQRTVVWETLCRALDIGAPEVEQQSCPIVRGRHVMCLGGRHSVPPRYYGQGRCRRRSSGPCHQLSPWPSPMIACAARRQGPHRFRGGCERERGLSPLTACLCAPLPARRSRRRAVSGRTLSAINIRNSNMPVCNSCEHQGEEHNWKLQRVRGHCMYPQCSCSRYVPRTDRCRPVNRLMGRVLYSRP